MVSKIAELTFDGFIIGSDVTMIAAFIAVLLRMRTSKSAKGLSLQSVIALVSLRMLHLSSHYFNIHYRPKVLPMWVFKSLDAGIVVAGLACLALLFTRYYSTYEVEKDNFGIQLFDKFNLVPKSGPFSYRPVAAASFLYIVVAVLACLWYLVRQGMPSFGLSCYCCYYEVMSAVSLIPQLWMFHKDKRVPELLANFVVLVAVGRLCTLGFWAVYPWIYRWGVPSNRSIHMALEAFNLLILSDFLYYWVRAKLRGEREVVLDNGHCDV